MYLIVKISHSPFYTFAHLKRRINYEKNKQKCKNLVITHREMCMKSQLLRQNTSGLLPVLNIDFTIFNIFCTAFLSLLWYISQLCLTD